MGTVENGSKVPPAAEGSLPSLGNARVQGSEKEGKELRVVSRVPENVVTENGGTDSQGLADSEMSGVSSLLKMRGNRRSAAHGCAEKLESVNGSEKGVAGAEGLSEGGEKKSEEEEKGEDRDGKNVIVDVPVVDSSENMDVEVEDLSDEEYGFSVGDFVWGKIKSHPWWPGRVYDPSDASDLALKMKRKNQRLLVAYFGDETFAWCHPSQLKPFKENFADMVKQSGSRSFVNAVQEAVNEVGRLLGMKMSNSFIANKTMFGLTPPRAKNAGIKEGVLVPEDCIERLSAVAAIEPSELLSRVKQVAEMFAIASILELEILKAQLSAFYLSRGGYDLTHYEDPQPVSGLEDNSVDETVDAGNGKSAVEVPVQRPFEECHSPGLSGNRSNPRRKQKSIAEILGEDKDDVHTKNKEGDATDEAVDATRSTLRKRREDSEDKDDVRTKNKEGDATDEAVDATRSTRRKRRENSNDKDEFHTKNKEGGATDEAVDASRSTRRKRKEDNEDEMTLKQVLKRKASRRGTNRNAPSAENNGSGGEENGDKDTESKEMTKQEAFDSEKIGHRSKKETDEEAKTREQNEMSSLPSPRERKRSKYLCPPFTTITGPRRGDAEGMPRAAGLPSPRVPKCIGDSSQENFPNEAAVEWELSDDSNHQTQEEEKTIDPQKIQAHPSEVLSEFRYAAISPQILRESTTLETFVDFISVFRSSLYSEGALYKVYKKSKPPTKRKKPENDNGVLTKDQDQPDLATPNHDSGPRKRRKKNQKPPSIPNVNGTDENTSPAAALFVSFWPGCSSLPSKSDLITVFSKFGALNEAETDMFRTNYTARVCFLKTSDAEKAFSYSQNTNPFGSTEVTFQLKYLSDGSNKSAEHGERSKSKRSRAKKKDKTPEATTTTPPPPVLLPQGGGGYLSDGSNKSGEDGERSKAKRSRAKKKDKTPSATTATPPSVSLPPPQDGGEASKLKIIRERLQGLTSMLEASDGDSADVKTKIVGEMKGLLEDLDKMVESSTS